MHVIVFTERPHSPTAELGDARHPASHPNRALHGFAELGSPVVAAPNADEASVVHRGRQLGDRRAARDELLSQQDVFRAEELGGVAALRGENHPRSIPRAVCGRGALQPQRCTGAGGAFRGGVDAGSQLRIGFTVGRIRAPRATSS